jgi:hypothetical protein
MTFVAGVRRSRKEELMPLPFSRTLTPQSDDLTDVGKQVATIRKELSSGNKHLKVFNASVSTGHLLTIGRIDVFDFVEASRREEPAASKHSDFGDRDAVPVDVALTR